MIMPVQHLVARRQQKGWADLVVREIVKEFEDLLVVHRC
jgi:hypothetical protein